MYIMYILICFKLSLLFAFLVEIIKMHRWWVYIFFKPSYWNFCYFYFSFDNVIIQNDWPHHLLAWSPSINLHNKLQVSELHTYLLIHFNVHFSPYTKSIYLAPALRWVLWSTRAQARGELLLLSSLHSGGIWVVLSSCLQIHFYGLCFFTGSGLPAILHSL